MNKLWVTIGAGAVLAGSPEAITERVYISTLSGVSTPEAVFSVSGVAAHPLIQFAGAFDSPFWDDVFDQIDNRRNLRE